MITIYIIARAICVGITDDEAWSFYNVKQFWYVETLCTGNTHWFNFAAIKLALLLGFEKVGYLRWLSVLSSVTLIYIGYIWIRSIKEFYLKLFAFSFLFLNHYLLDYLSLARGYATGLAFMVLSLLFLVKLYKENDSRLFALASLVFAGLSAIANFNFFYYFSAFCVMYLYNCYFKNGFSFLKNKRFYVDVFYSICITLLVLRALLFITECSNDIAGCGGEELIDSVFGSFFHRMISGSFNLKENALSVLGYSFFLLITVASCYGAFSFKRHQNQLYVSGSIILFLMLSLAIFNKVCFGVLYPMHRTTLMFFPLFGIVLVGFFNSISSGMIVKQILVYLFSIFFVINFALQANLKYTLDYRQQTDAGSAYEIISDLKAKNIGICPELYIVFLKYYSITYTDLRGEMINTILPIPVWLKEKQNQLEDFDHLILFPPYDLSYYKGAKIKLEGVMLYAETKTLVVKVVKR